MSEQADLTAAFAERELTVPVLLVGAGTVARAFFDRKGSVRSIGSIGMGVLAEQDTLTLMHGALAGAAQESQVIVGPVGADVADEAQGGVRYRVVRSPQRIDDGLLDELQLAGGSDR